MACTVTNVTTSNWYVCTLGYDRCCFLQQQMATNINLWLCRHLINDFSDWGEREWKVWFETKLFDLDCTGIANKDSSITLLCNFYLSPKIYVSLFSRKFAMKFLKLWSFASNNFTRIRLNSLTSDWLWRNHVMGWLTPWLTPCSLTSLTIQNDLSKINLCNLL